MLLLLAGLLLPRGDVAAQAPAPTQVAGEIVLGWRDAAPACASVTPAQAATGLGQETCRLLADLAAVNLNTDVWPDGLHRRPEWQAAQRSLAALTGLEVRDLLLAHGVARLGVAPGREAAEIARLSALPWVAYAEPNHIARAAAVPQADARYPNDPFIGEQWNMRRVFAPEAWALTQGSDAIVVAVIDSGVDLGHPELAGRLVLGKNYLQPGAPPQDDYSHGTHIAGLLAANADNGMGVSGLAPLIRVLPLKVLNAQGEGTYFNIAAAIRDATDLNARIINLSLAGYDVDQTLQDAVNYALGRGRLVVAATGNCAQGGQGCPPANPSAYPAAYPGVLAVGASDRFDQWANYSGYKSYVGLAAPGGILTDQIWSTLPGGRYGALFGTSMSAPLVSAAAALVWAVRPTASAGEVMDILKNTADKVGVDPFSGQPIPYVNGRNDFFGFGRLNVVNAVRLAHPPALAPVNTTPSFLTTDPSKSSTRAVTVLNPSAQTLQWQAQTLLGADWLRVEPSSGQTAFGSPGALTLRAGPAALAPGVYTGLVRVAPMAPLPAAPIDIPVELHVVAQVYSGYLPLIGRNWFSLGWFDPQAPDAPPPLTLNLTNDAAYPVSLPFPIMFYGNSYTAAWVSDNGLLWFGQGSAASLRAPGGCLPSAAAPNNAIYALALDWDPALGGQVYAHRPNADTFVITWHEVRRPWNAMPQSFQVILTRGGGIAVSYRAIEALPPALIGTENHDGTVTQQVYCSGAGQKPNAGASLRFAARLPWQ